MSDTGRGYDPAGVGGPEEGHLGLSIRTGPGVGTIVSLSLDLEQAVAGRSPRLPGLPEQPNTPSGPALQH